MSYTLSNESVFYSGSVTNTNTCSLSTTVIISAYNRNSNIYAKVGTISGTTISWGSETLLVTAGKFTGSSQMCAISSSLFVLTYSNNSNSYPYTVACTVSGTTITVGTPVQVNNSALLCPPTICNMGADSFAIAYSRSGASYAVVGTISTRTITLGSASYFVAQNVLITQITRLSSTDFVVSYTDSYYHYLYQRSATISGKTITYGTLLTSLSYTSTCINVALSSTKYISFYTDGSNYLRSNVYSISSGTITLLTSQNLNSSSTTNVLSLGYNSSYGSIIYVIGGVAIVNLFNVDGLDNISISDSTNLNGGGLTDYINNYLLDSSTLIIGYQDTSNYSYGTSVIASIVLPLGKKINGIMISKWNGITPSKINSI